MMVIKSQTQKNEFLTVARVNLKSEVNEPFDPKVIFLSLLLVKVVLIKTI